MCIIQYIVTSLHNQHLSQIPEYFHYPEKKPISVSSHSSYPIPGNFCCYGCAYSRHFTSMESLAFCVWLLSFSIMFSGFIHSHVVAEIGFLY